MFDPHYKHKSAKPFGLFLKQKNVFGGLVIWQPCVYKRCLINQLPERAKRHNMSRGFHTQNTHTLKAISQLTFGF